MIKRLKDFWNCKVLGKHQYLTHNAVYQYDVFSRTYIFRNFCMKCGRKVEVAISAEVFLDRTPLPHEVKGVTFDGY